MISLERLSAFKTAGIVLILSSIFLLWGNHLLPLTNPDEVFYAQTAKEMAYNNTWWTPYLFDAPQFEKPILTYWLIRIGFILFGVTSFAARFFPAAFGILGAITVYFLAMIGFKDKKKAFLAAYCTMSGGLYIGMSRTVFTDMIFSVLILCALTFFYWGYTNKKRKREGILLLFISAALAALAKGPLGILIPLAAVLLFLFLQKDLSFLNNRYTVWGSLLCIGIAAPWYLSMINTFGKTFTHEFFYNDHIRRLIEAEHRSNDTWFFYPVSMILCMFPWSFFVPAGAGYLIKRFRQKKTSVFQIFLVSWITACLCAFQFAHSKLVSYILPLFPALAIIVAEYAYAAIKNKNSLSLRIVLWLTQGVLILMGIALIVSMYRFPHYVTSRGPIYAFTAGYIVFLIIVAKILSRRKYITTVYLTGFCLPALIYFAFLSHKEFDHFVSSKESAAFVMEHYSGTSPLLCSKSFVRGVRYYTDMEVAAINMGETFFFSPHPITYINKPKHFKRFFNKNRLVYAIFTKSGFADAKRILHFMPQYRVELLKVIGDEYIVRIKFDKNLNKHTSS